MENRKDPELYEKCKKIVKKWEFDFTEKNGRVPSKLDIREADESVRYAYRKYFQLKTAALMDVVNFEIEPDNSSEICNLSNNSETNNSVIESEKPQEQKTEDDVWGKHLNKPQDVKKPEEKKEKILSNFTKKLFNNSKFLKRNPRSRSSLNLSRNNSLDCSQINTSVTESLSQPNPIEDDVKILNFNCTLPVISDKISFSQPVNLIDQVLKNSFSLPKRSIDQGWLQRTSLNTGTSITDENVKEISESIVKENQKKPVIDCDIISDSDDEEERSFHILKKRKLSNNSTLSSNSSLLYKTDTSTEQDNSLTQKRDTNIFNISNLETKIVEKIETPVIKEQINKPEIECNGEKEIDNNVLRTVRKQIVKNKEINELESDEEDPYANSDEDSDYDPMKENKKGKKRIPDSDEDIPQGTKPKRGVKKGKKKILESDEDTPKGNKRKRGVKKSPKPKRGARKKDKSPEKEETQEYVLEYSVKPPPKTVPRIKKLPKKIKEVIQVDEEVPTKKSVAESKLKKKIKAGTLNENFVRIDITKKVYMRGKKQLNFSKYKKNLWKNKKKALYGPDMDMGGCDGGVLTCFKCGQSGHMARQCKAAGDKLLPLEADEEICPYPSLEEATEMAHQSVLAVHKPTIIKPTSTSEEKEPELEEVNKDVQSESDEEFEIEDDEDLEAFMMTDEVEKVKSLQIPLNYFIDEEKFVKPLYDLNEDGSVIGTPKEVMKALKLFGHESFRPGQERAIMRILSGKSSLVTLSTGSGKSLCYQLPAYLYAQRSNCISLVISPLVSLMDDQVSGMPAFLKAACLHTSQTNTQKDKIMKLIDSGDLNVLLVSPEAVTAGEKVTGFGSLLRKLPPIAFACIDEAHCVSQWSHNFRPSYLMICHVLRERLGIKTILGLTATATFATSSSIVQHLQIPDGYEGIISDIPLPDNLHLSVSCDAQRDHALRNLLMAEPYVNYESIIVYCTRREECDRIASHLRTSIRSTTIPTPIKKYKSVNPIAESYHAGLASSRRRTVQNAFMGGHVKIVVATIAFGMGINKSDIRAVIHYNMPSSFECYVQEVGRSGRDGLPAHCHVFLNHEGKDLNELKRHIYANSMDRHVIRKLLQKIFVPCNCTKVCPRHEVAFSIQETVQYLDVPEENISTLLCYLELHEKRYIEVLTPAYTICKVIAYGSSNYIRKAAADCPPLAMALALHVMKDEKDDVFEFPVIDVAAAMGWDSGIVKHKLKNLEWVIENGQSKRSKLSVQFSNLGFRLRAPGNLSPFELDETLDSLYNKKTIQEQTSLKQLHVVHKTLTSVAEPFYRNCLSENYNSKFAELKTKVREYFSSEEPLKDVEIIDKTECCEPQIKTDIRSVIAMYRDNNFTGRAIARIFHGIQSPNYPAVIWGRSKFWRAHLNVDFNKLCSLSTAEILSLR